MQRLLDDAKRMVLGWPGPTKPMLAPMAFWWDGGNLWLSTSGSAGKVRALRRSPDCVAWVPPLRPDADGADDGDPEASTGVVVRGTARVFSPTDVRAMAAHGPVIAAAQAALAVKNYASVAGYAVDAARIPARWLPTGRVMLRIAVDEITPVDEPAIGKGIAPALPTSVPPEIRRQLAGQRRVVLATSVGGTLGMLPAVWGAGMQLDIPAGLRLSEGAAVSAVVDHDPGFRPTEVVGVTVHGTVEQRRLKADAVRWWQGFEQGRADVTGGSMAAPIVIPD